MEDKINIKEMSHTEKLGMLLSNAIKENKKLAKKIKFNTKKIRAYRQRLKGVQMNDGYISPCQT